MSPNYGGHAASVWVFGALEPATGIVLTTTCHLRDEAIDTPLHDPPR
jgi:hypothetical protein